MNRSVRRCSAGGPWRLAVLALTLAAALPGVGGAHAPTNGFSDDFTTTGPLPASPGDAYEIKAGTWTVVDRGIVNAPGLGTISQAGSRRVLLQESRAGTCPPPQKCAEPMVFIRGRAFRSFTAQVTAALIDNNPGTSIGMLFRAPVREDATADPDNLYLFDASRTGIVGPFTTGQAFILWKRVAGGYFMLTSKIANSRFDLTMPHDYKVVMAGGHIQAFVDGRLVIDHVDKASGDQPTASDPFPGLPFDAGSVGLRTSGARGWFDDLRVVGADGYEGRASAIDAFAEAGVDFSGIRDGRGTQLTSLVKTADTGYRYHDHDGFDDAVIERFDPFDSDRFTAGMDLRTRGVDGATVSTAQLAGVSIKIVDPTKRFLIEIRADAIEQSATATCEITTSTLSLENATVTVSFTPDGVPGLPPESTTHVLENGYGPNTVIYDSPGQLRILAHAKITSPTTKRVEVSGFKIVIPDQAAAVGAANTGQRVPGTEITLANVVAARYCT